MELTIGVALDGERVDRAVALVTGLSRSACADLVARGEVAVDGVAVTARSVRVRAGQSVEIRWEVADAVPPISPDPSVALDLVYVDDDIIVVNKAPGVVVHPGNGVKGATLAASLLAAFAELAEVGEAHRPGIVHRLDRGTSGLLVVARTQAAYHGLVGQLSEHDVARTYLALVAGTVATAAGEIDAPIGRSRHDATRRAVVADGLPARTTYSLCATFDQPAPLSLLRCGLYTGRTHQIRVHLQAIGHPVVADTTYGGARLNLGLDRPFLHAAELAFEHPRTGAPMQFAAPLPEDLAGVLVRLGVAPAQVGAGLPGLTGLGRLPGCWA